MANEPKLGQLVEGDQPRDAIHVAIVPVTADERLVPGTHVGFTREGDTERVGVRTTQLLGVVDPFLIGFVNEGERFYLFLYPQTITSLRHDWTHPAFEAVKPAPVVSARAASEQWLRMFCATADCPGYEAVMELIAKGAVRGEYGTSRIEDEYMFFSGSNAHGEIPPEFWTHVEIVLGRPVQQKPTYFSCSC